MVSSVTTVYQFRSSSSSSLLNGCVIHQKWPILGLESGRLSPARRYPLLLGWSYGCHVDQYCIMLDFSTHHFCLEEISFHQRQNIFLMRSTRSYISTPFSLNQYCCTREMRPIVLVHALWMADLSASHCWWLSASAEGWSARQAEGDSWSLFFVHPPTRWEGIK